VRVVAPGRVEAHERAAERIEIFRYAAPAKPLSTLKPWNPVDAFWLARVLRGGARATRAAVAAGATAHVFALWGLPSGEWARRAAAQRGLAYSVWLLGSDVWTLGRLPIARGLLTCVLREAAHRYADGHRLAADARAIGGTQVEFLPSTRALETRTPPPLPRPAPPYRLLFLGRWHPNKGVDILLDALATGSASTRSTSREEVRCTSSYTHASRRCKRRDGLCASRDFSRKPRPKLRWHAPTGY